MAFYVTLAARCLLGLVFAVSAFSKIRSPASFRSFAAWLAGLPVLSPSARKALAPCIAASEVSIVMLLALPWTVEAGLILAAVTMATFTMGTVIVVRRGVAAPCQCFGPSSTPLRPLHAARDALLCAVAAAATFASRAAGGVARPPGVLFSLAVAAVTAMLVLFLDDLVTLSSDRGQAGS